MAGGKAMLLGEATIAAFSVGAGCAPACVARGTLVETRGGPRLIEDLRVGDVVLAVDTEKRVLEDAPIVRVTSSRRECVVLVAGSVELCCTPDHPLFDPDEGGFRPAGDWAEGRARRVLRGADGAVTPVAVERAILDGGVHDVFDLTVGGAHPTFLASGIVVHNKSVTAPWTYTGSIEGPTVELSAGIPVKRFEIRPCLDPSAEVESRVRFDAWGTPDDGVDTGAGTARFALVTLSGVEGDALVGDGDVFDSIWVAAQFDESACADGMVLELRYTTPQLGGQIEVEWEAEIQVESDFDGVATLEIVPLP